MILQHIKKETPDKKTYNYLILDTCIIQHSASSDKPKSEAFLQLLDNLRKENFRLAISTYSVYENLNNLWGKKARAAYNILKSYEWKNVSENVLIFASRFRSLYHNEKIDYMHDGDIIIGTTAFLVNGFVLTENHRDFPHPYFITYRSIPLQYIMNRRVHKTCDLAIYRPDILLIKRRIIE